MIKEVATEVEAGVGIEVEIVAQIVEVEATEIEEDKLYIRE